MRHQEVKMVYSYFPGCTLKTKAKDLDRYGRESAKEQIIICSLSSLMKVRQMYFII